ncbi:MAG: zinc-ribbon domain-containing protein [Ruminococcus sp.]|jgi:hypothetical protein|nr:zinc-ribbon domain-containing protein [Ruminococcus sp.]
MNSYIGAQCMVCENIFKEGDDVVFCPDCGTPFHRSCFKSVGHCINETLHASGEEWTPPKDIGETRDTDTEENEDTLCKRCGKQNLPSAYFCSACGFPLQHLVDTEHPGVTPPSDAFKGQKWGGYIPAENPDEYHDNLTLHPQLVNFSDPLCGFSPDEEYDEGVTLGEIAEYVDTNTHYYLPIFKNIKTYGTGFAWNFIALLFPELYFAYRKMPLYALVALFLRFALIFPEVIRALSLTQLSGAVIEWAQGFNTQSTAFVMLLTLFQIANFVRMFFFASNANKMYYKKVINSVLFWRELYTHREEFPDVIAAEQPIGEVLRKHGGTSPFWLIVFILLLCLPIGILMMQLSTYTPI